MTLDRLVLGKGLEYQGKTLYGKSINFEMVENFCKAKQKRLEANLKKKLIYAL